MNHLISFAKNYDFNFFGLPPLIAALILLLVGTIVLIKKKYIPSAVGLFIVSLFVSVWLFSYAFMYWSINYNTAFMWANIAYLTVPLASVSIYIFTVVILDKFQKRIVPIVLGLSIGLFFIVMQSKYYILFNTLHHYWWGYYPIYDLIPSIIYLCYFFSYTVLSLFEFWREYRVTPGDTIKHERIKYMMLAISIAYLGTVDYIAKYGVAIYPFGYIPIMIFVLILSYVIVRYKLVDLTPSFAAKQILKIMADPLIVCDSQGYIRIINQALTKILGYEENELLEKSINFLMLDHSNNRSIDLFQLIQNNAITINDELLFKTKFGVPIFVSISFSELQSSNSKSIEGWVIIARDIRERKKAESQLSYLAEHDHLTGLLNRRSFENHLIRHINNSKNSYSMGALLLLDIDHFKDINDSFGHNIGDQLLLNIVKIIKTQLRKSDLVARLGGDEFAIILPDINVEVVKHITSKIIETISDTKIQLNDHTFNVTISIGITLFPIHDDLSENLLTYADLALYKAKQNGRNTYCLYSSNKNWQTPFKTNITWATRIKNALKENKFVLYAQPIVDLKTKNILFYETLLRIKDEKNQAIAPSIFLNVAERYGLMREINFWVVNEVLTILSRNKQLCLTCNISVNALSNKPLFHLIENAVKSRTIEPSHLILEVTENSVISGIEHALTFISETKSLGVKFALDDFGTGMSSLTHLKYLKFDYLKIDGSFVKSSHTNKLDRELVRAIIDIAKVLNIKTIAEYIESQEVADILTELNADYGQGFLYGIPKPLTEIITESETVTPDPVLSLNWKKDHNFNNLGASD